MSEQGCCCTNALQQPRSKLARRTRCCADSTDTHRTLKQQTTDASTTQTATSAAQHNTCHMQALLLHHHPTTYTVHAVKQQDSSTALHIQPAFRSLTDAALHATSASTAVLPTNVTTTLCWPTAVTFPHAAFPALLLNSNCFPPFSHLHCAEHNCQHTCTNVKAARALQKPTRSQARHKPYATPRQGTYRVARV